MSTKRIPENILRLRRKHGDGRGSNATASDGERLLRAQSFRNAVVAGVVVLLLFCVGWTALSVMTDRVFPWMTMVLGYLLGLSIRHAGRGVDWRFPTFAAGMALAGSIIGNIVLAASTTADSYETGTVDILQAVTVMTWPVFFDEIWNVADGFFAVVSACVAAFFASRRLTRSQFYALRKLREQSDGHK